MRETPDETTTVEPEPEEGDERNAGQHDPLPAADGTGDEPAADEPGATEDE